MFFGSDRSFLLASDSGPCSFGEDGPREPAEINGQVVEPSEIVPHAVSVCMEDREHVGGGRLGERFGADRIIGLAAKTSGASLLGRRNAVRGHFIHHGLPRPARHLRIVRDQICASEIEIQSRLAMRFVHRIQQPFCFASFGRAKAALLFRTVLLPVKIAVTPAIQSVFELHAFLHVEENARAEFFPLTSTRGVAAEFARIVSSALDLLAIPLAFGLRTVLPAGEAPLGEALKIWLQR